MKNTHSQITYGPALPPGYRVLEKGERIHKDDKTTSGFEEEPWKLVSRSIVGGKHNGAAKIITPLPAPSQSETNLETVIREKVNKLEIERDRLRFEIDNPPAGAGVYYFTDRTSEHRTICQMIDAIRDLLK